MVVGCYFLFVGVCCLSFKGCWLLVVGCCSLCGVCCLLFVVFCVFALFVFDWGLLVVGLLLVDGCFVVW